MLRHEIVRQIEEARQELNDMLGTYEDGQDDEDIIHLSQCLDELILQYMQLTK